MKALLLPWAKLLYINTSIVVTPMLAQFFNSVLDLLCLLLAIRKVV